MKNLKRSMSGLTLAFLAFVLMVPSCSPYEEGPGLSFNSAEKRVEGTWTVKRATKTENGTTTDETSDYDDDSFTFNEDGTATHTFTSSSTQVTSSGSWSLLNDDETLRLTESWTFLGTTYTESHDWSIKRLTQGEMIIESKTNDVTTRLELGSV